MGRGEKKGVIASFSVQKGREEKDEFL